tara:strand:+ start:8203 stop:8397 length:195 start_codon:yes stop_codon:yes gene_type:complete
MKFTKGDVLLGYQGTKVKLLSNINKTGQARVEVLASGLLTQAKVGDVINGFTIYGGAIYFDKGE